MRLSPHAIGVALVTAASVVGWQQGKNVAASEYDAGAKGGPIAGRESVEPGEPVEANGSTVALLQAWAKRLAAADGAGLAALAEEAAREPDQEIRARLMRLVTARWSEVDPEGGVAYFRAPGDLFQRSALLAEWALRDVEAAWSFLSDLGDEHEAVIGFVGRTLMREDADAFWAWFQKARRPNPGNTVPGREPDPVWMEIARRHPAELEAMAHAVAADAKGGNPRDQAASPAALLALVAAVRAEEDPAAALEWARALPAEFRAACFQRVLSTLAESDPHAAMAAFDAQRENDWATGETERRKTLEALPDLLKAVGKSAPEAAVAWAAQRMEGTQVIAPVTDIVRSALADGRLTPQAAYALIHDQQTPGEAIRLNVFRDMWCGLPAETLAESAAWLNGVESTPFKGLAMAGLVTEWAFSNREAAFAFARSVEDPEVRHSIWRDVLGAGFGFGSLAAALGSQLAVVPAIDRPAVIPEHLRSYYGAGSVDSRHGVLTQDPHFFAEALMEAPAGQDRAEATRKVMDYWGALDPASAMAWAGRQTEGAERAQALAGLVAGWARHDAWAVSEWLADQPVGADRDAATRQFAQSISPTDPEAAWIWAADIADSETRVQAGIEVLQRWRTSDAGGAEAALAAATHLAPHERQSIVEALTRDREPQ